MKSWYIATQSVQSDQEGNQHSVTTTQDTARPTIIDAPFAKHVFIEPHYLTAAVECRLRL
jgi:hypothetical protein